MGLAIAMCIADICASRVGLPMGCAFWTERGATWSGSIVWMWPTGSISGWAGGGRNGILIMAEPGLLDDIEYEKGTSHQVSQQFADL